MRQENCETLDLRQETGDRRCETVNGRQDTGDGRWVSDVISGTFSSFNLAGKCYKFLKIAN